MKLFNYKSKTEGSVKPEQVDGNHALLTTPPLTLAFCCKPIPRLLPLYCPGCSVTDLALKFKYGYLIIRKSNIVSRGFYHVHLILSCFKGCADNSWHGENIA